MGGSGSGRWNGHRKALAVESCYCIKVMPGGKVSATTAGGSWVIHIERQLDVDYLVLRGHWNGWKADVWIQVQYWRPRFGGQSLFLICPVCGRRCRKLYAPPKRVDYHCRICWKLAYASSQEAHKWDRGATAAMLAPMYAQEGISMRQVEKWMRAKGKAR